MEAQELLDICFSLSSLASWDLGSNFQQATLLWDIWSLRAPPPPIFPTTTNSLRNLVLTVSFKSKNSCEIQQQEIII